MNLTLDRQRMEVIPIIAKPLEDKALEEGEEFEYIPMEAGGLHIFLLLRRGKNLLFLSWQSTLNHFRPLS